MTEKYYAPEIAALLNPGFMSLNIAAAVAGYSKMRSTGMPWPLLYPAMALALHTSTRELLPSTTKTKFLTWLEGNQEVLVGFSKRTASLRDIVNYGLIAASNLDFVAFGGDGRIESRRSIPAKYLKSGTNESADCIRAAQRVGGLFAGVNETHLVFIVLGIRP